MSNVETAELKLSELNGGRFQILAVRYVGCKYGIPSVHHSGRSFGTEETTIGTPDCFLAKPNGHFIFVECGKRGDRRTTLDKLGEDVQHCLTYEANHPEAGVIDEIVCCYGFPRLSSGDLMSIKAMDERVALIGPEEIAEACVSKYPWLARDYLDIEVGSGAFLDTQAFIDKNHNARFAPDLDQSLIGRDRELADVCEVMQHSQAILLSGTSGCGKTKLALEACKTMAATHNAEFYIVTPTRQDIYEDLKVFLSGNRLTYLLLDDANQLAGLRTAVDYVLDKPNIKLVVTCRNYAKESVVEELKHIKRFEEIDLRPLPAEDFNQILETEMCLGDAVVSSRITSIVKGNLRLAFLLSEACGDGESVTTMQELLKAVYKDKLSGMDVMEQQAIAIASILGPHMTESNDQLDGLLHRFGLPREKYISSCHALHDRELLDATPGFEAVSFEEQNLRDYFLYHSLVVTSVVQLSDLWNMRSGKTVCVNSLNTVFATFRDEQTRQELTRQLEELLYSTHDDDEALQVIDAFGLLLGKAGFTRLCSIIPSRAAASCEEVSYSSFDFYANNARGALDCLELSALSPFLLTEEFGLSAVRLVFTLLKHVRLSDADAEELFERRLCAGSFRPCIETKVEDEVLRLLERGGLSDDGSAESVFKILFAKGVLSDVLHYTQALSLNEVGFGSYHRVYTEGTMAVRSRCVQMLARLYQDNGQWDCQIRNVLLGYRHYPGGDKLLSKGTYELVLKSVCPMLRFSSLEECEEVQGFVKAAAKADVDARDATVEGLGGGKRFVMSILDRERFPDDEAFVHLANDAAALPNQDWEELLKLLVPQNQRTTHSYTVDGVIARLLESAQLDTSIEKLITRGVASSAVYLPRAIDACAARYLEWYGWPNGRTKIIEEAPLRMHLWLVCFDQHAISHGFVPSLNQLTESLEGCGEVLPFETVCEMERAVPGTFDSYVRRLVEQVDKVVAARWHYLPYTLDEMDSCMTSECCKPDNWAALAGLLCSLAPFANQDPSKEVVGHIIKEVPTCLPEYFASIVRRDSYEVSDVPWEAIFEAVGIDSAIEAIRRAERNASSGDGCALGDYAVRHSCRRLVLESFNAAEAAGIGAEFDEWACERISGACDELVELVVDAATALDYQHRFALAIRSAHAGVDVSLFSELAFGFPFDGISWTGSEQPLLREMLEYFERVESQLLKDGLLEYIPSASEAIRQVKDRQRVVQIREFVDPYIRHDDKS